MNYLPNHDEWPPGEHLPQLTDEEHAALDEIPDDAVSHWWRGERWDFEKKVWWIPFRVLAVIETQLSSSTTIVCKCCNEMATGTANSSTLDTSN